MFFKKKDETLDLAIGKVSLSTLKQNKSMIVSEYKRQIAKIKKTVNYASDKFSNYIEKLMATESGELDNYYHYMSFRRYNSAPWEQVREAEGKLNEALRQSKLDTQKLAKKLQLQPAVKKVMQECAPLRKLEKELDLINSGYYRGLPRC